jgi:hypothetical protein
LNFLLPISPIKPEANNQTAAGMGTGDGLEIPNSRLSKNIPSPELLADIVILVNVDIVSTKPKK